MFGRTVGFPPARVLSHRFILSTVVKTDGTGPAGGGAASADRPRCLVLQCRRLDCAIDAEVIALRHGDWDDRDCSTGKVECPFRVA